MQVLFKPFVDQSLQKFGMMYLYCLVTDARGCEQILRQLRSSA